MLATSMHAKWNFCSQKKAKQNIHSLIKEKQYWAVACLNWFELGTEMYNPKNVPFPHPINELLHLENTSLKIWGWLFNGVFISFCNLTEVTYCALHDK